MTATSTTAHSTRSSMTDHTTDIGIPCINGCTRKAIDGEPATPLIARHGAFCLRCYGRAERALKMAPDLVEHIVSSFPKSPTKSVTDIRVGGSTEHSLGAFSEQAWVDADQLYAILVRYASQWAKALGVTPPAPAQYAWRVEHKTVVGLPASMKPSDARFAAGVMAAWIHIHLPSIFERGTTAVALFIEDLGLVGETAARWPTDTKPRWSEMLHQDNDCGGRIAYFPPGAAGGDITIACERCGHHFELDEYEEAVHAYLTARQAERQAEQRAAYAATRKANRPEQVRQFLIDKYIR
jgi:hypothetical protein